MYSARRELFCRTVDFIKSPWPHIRRAHVEPLWKRGKTSWEDSDLYGTVNAPLWFVSSGGGLSLPAMPWKQWEANLTIWFINQWLQQPNALCMAGGPAHNALEPVWVNLNNLIYNSIIPYIQRTMHGRRACPSSRDQNPQSKIPNPKARHFPWNP